MSDSDPSDVGSNLAASDAPSKTSKDATRSGKPRQPTSTVAPPTALDPNTPTTLDIVPSLSITTNLEALSSPQTDSQFVSTATNLASTTAANDASGSPLSSESGSTTIVLSATLMATSTYSFSAEFTDMSSTLNGSGFSYSTSTEPGRLSITSSAWTVSQKAVATGASARTTTTSAKPAETSRTNAQSGNVGSIGIDYIRVGGGVLGFFVFCILFFFMLRLILGIRRRKALMDERADISRSLSRGFDGTAMVNFSGNGYPTYRPDGFPYHADDHDYVDCGNGQIRNLKHAPPVPPQPHSRHPADIDPYAHAPPSAPQFALDPALAGHFGPPRLFFGGNQNQAQIDPFYPYPPPESLGFAGFGPPVHMMPSNEYALSPTFVRNEGPGGQPVTDAPFVPDQPIFDGYAPPIQNDAGHDARMSHLYQTRATLMPVLESTHENANHEEPQQAYQIESGPLVESQNTRIPSVIGRSATVTSITTNDNQYGNQIKDTVRRHISMYSNVQTQSSRIDV